MRFTLRRTGRTHARGFTIVEACVATALAAVVLLGLNALHMQCLRETREQRETQAATLGLQERMDQLCALSWFSLLDPSHARAMLSDLTSAPPTNAQLPELKEMVQVKCMPLLGLELPVVTPVPDAWTLTRQADGSLVGSAVGIGLTALSTQVTVTFTWRSGSRMRTRALTTLVTLKPITL